MTASPAKKTTSRRKSGNPAVRDDATPLSEWKKAKPKATLLPSGKYMIYKRIGLDVFLNMGMLPNSLMGFAQRAVERGKGKEMTSNEVADLMGKPDMITEITTFIDKAVCFVAIEPKVHPIPENEADRDDELLYIDEIELEDKMFIWQSVTGGTTNVETFRTDAAAVLDSVHRS